MSKCHIFTQMLQGNAVFSIKKIYKARTILHDRRFLTNFKSKKSSGKSIMKAIKILGLLKWDLSRQAEGQRNN